MILTNWPNGVNTKFYGFQKKPKENTKKFDSVNGRSVAYLTNTKSVMTYSMKIDLEVGTEEDAFISWFNDTLGGLSGAFTCSAIGNKNYCFAAIPSPNDTDLRIKSYDLEIEEVY